MTEMTLVMPVNYLPEGQNAVWMADLNMVLIRDTLDEIDAHRALIDLSAEWRRSFLHLVMPKRPPLEMLARAS